MGSIAIDREVTFAVENDIVVDDDRRLGHHCGRSVAIERKRSAALGNRSPDSCSVARANAVHTDNVTPACAALSAIASGAARPAVRRTTARHNQRNQDQRSFPEHTNSLPFRVTNRAEGGILSCSLDFEALRSGPGRAAQKEERPELSVIPLS